MRKLLVFENISLDGYFADANNDMSFAKKVPDDAEFDAFVAQNAGGEGVLLFGRVTYEMMASFWPTPVAAEMFPAVAKRMNSAPKVVFSKTLHEASWSNAATVSDDPADYVRKLKEEPGPDLCVLGSGQIVSQLAQAGLIDEYQFVTVPTAIGRGRTLFEALTHPISLRLTGTRSFSNGLLFTKYEGVKDATADHSLSVV
jgi:dihydrofolate reductase